VKTRPKVTPVPRPNNANPTIGIIRALLAVMVIYYHSYLLTNHGDPIQSTGTNFGEIAVDNFFF
jgi:peptidoglycan/LPS O-acetylase OafA/YrhL